MGITLVNQQTRKDIMKTAQYRFDDAYGSVYEYSADCNAYVYVCSYVQSGITSKMSESRKIAKMQDYNCREADVRWHELESTQ